MLEAPNIAYKNQALQKKIIINSLPYLGYENEKILKLNFHLLQLRD